MTNNEIIKNFDANRVIYTPDGLKTTIGQLDNTPNYHSSWVWLMPIVESLEKLGCEIESKSKYDAYRKAPIYHTVVSLSDYSCVSSTGCRLVTGSGDNRIESIYNAVVNAITSLEGVKK